MADTLSEKQIREFQEKILSWYAKNQRDLPWRKTRDPYKILISEIMSQQTQISRVISKYEAWIQELPTLTDLATAPISTVLRLWSGLGYNRRALSLQKAAKVIIETYGGEFPQTGEELQKLPGVGKYTASAVACFAFDAQIPVIDTNVRKVILIHFSSCHCKESEMTKQSHIKDCRAALAMTEKNIEEVAWKLLPVGNAYHWNQALMDYAGAELKAYKIPVPKQSKLLGSDRYYRGQTLKYLLSAKSIRHRVTVNTLLEYFEGKNQTIVKKRFEQILSEMEKEGFIKRRNETILLPD